MIRVSTPQSLQQVASYAAALWASHAIFLPHVFEKDCMTGPKGV